MGRPNEKREFSDKEISQIETMSAYGLKVEQMAVVLGVSKPTFDRRVSENEKVADALLKGRAASQMNVVETAYKMATSGKSPTMTIFWLKCRAGWKESFEDLGVKREGSRLIIDFGDKKPGGDSHAAEKGEESEND